MTKAEEQDSKDDSMSTIVFLNPKENTQSSVLRSKIGEELSDALIRLEAKGWIIEKYHFIPAKRMLVAVD